MQKRYEEIVERQRGIWEGHDEARQVIDCFAVELEQLGILPVQTPPEPPKNTWLVRLRDRLKNPTPYEPRYANEPHPTGMARITAQRKDLHDVMRHATLAEVEVALKEQERYANQLYYAHEAAMELLSDMRVVKRGI